MTNETSRIEAYSDGIFSIAATLLVLELKPPAPDLPFWQGVLHQWPGYASFLLSFLYIGIVWINHHRLFSHIRRSDEVLLAANLLLLLGVVWIPYPTSLMAQSVATGQIRAAAIFYNGSYLALSIAFNLLLQVSIRRKLVDCDPASISAIYRYYMTGTLLSALCFAVCWWSVPLSLMLNGSMALYFLISPGVSFTRHVAHSHQGSV